MDPTELAAARAYYAKHGLPKDADAYPRWYTAPTPARGTPEPDFERGHAVAGTKHAAPGAGDGKASAEGRFEAGYSSEDRYASPEPPSPASEYFSSSSMDSGTSVYGDFHTAPNSPRPDVSFGTEPVAYPTPNASPARNRSSTVHTPLNGQPEARHPTQNANLTGPGKGRAFGGDSASSKTKKGDVEPLKRPIRRVKIEQ